MGIDVYLQWDEMSQEEKSAQITGFDIHSGHVGYLREAYHGPPYATEVLVSENWDEQPDDGFKISNAELRKRLPDVLEATAERYSEEEPEFVEKCKKSYTDFVVLHGMMEKAGRNPRIIVSY